MAAGTPQLDEVRRGRRRGSAAAADRVAASEQAGVEPGALHLAEEEAVVVDELELGREELVVRVVEWGCAHRGGVVGAFRVLEDKEGGFVSEL